jgi:hypothetical protein
MPHCPPEIARLEAARLALAEIEAAQYIQATDALGICAGSERASCGPQAPSPQLRVGCCPRPGRQGPAPIAASRRRASGVGRRSRKAIGLVLGNWFLDRNLKISPNPGISRSRGTWIAWRCKSTVPGQSSKPVPAARWARGWEMRSALVGRSERSTHASLHNGQRP